MLSPEHANYVDDYLEDLSASLNAVVQAAGSAEKKDVRYS
jgi:antirestriction protein ArdC